MRTRQGETICLGEWISPASAVSRPQEGFGDESARVRFWVFCASTLLEDLSILDIQ